MLESLSASRIRRSTLLPTNWVASLKAARILWRDYAHVKTVAARQSIDAAGNPLPWYTYPAIEFLSQLDFTARHVFEFGSGMSTLFWAQRAQDVVSVEDDDRWFETMSARVPDNVRLQHEADLSRFAHTIDPEGEFDVIVVDGPARGRTRLKCCRAALTHLREGGLVILDNSDWLPESSRLLRDSGLLEVDFTGFAPICGHVQTTSLYFHRAFNVAPATGRQPMAGHGSRPSLWERPLVAVPGALVTCDDEPFRGVTDDVTFEKDAPSGPRRFRAISYLGGDDERCIAILDLDRDRVLLTRHQPRGRSRADQLAAEIARIQSMDWPSFTRFIAEHEYRRYVL